MSKISSVMKSLMAAMKKRPDCIHSASESVSKMMEEGSPELVAQALDQGMVAYLLELLDSPLTEVDKPSATKAIIAESLKLMAKDLANGERVSKLDCINKMNTTIRLMSYWMVLKCGVLIKIRSMTCSFLMLLLLVTLRLVVLVE